VSDYKVSQLLDVIKRQNAGLEQLIAERDRLRTELDAFVAWANGDHDALTCLQRVYCDPSASVPNKIKAAASALPFERPKPPSSSVVAITDWEEYTRGIRLRQLEKDRARWAAEDAAKVIEHQPLDLDAPTPETILGGDDSAA
jgi:hypothetical protein